MPSFFDLQRYAATGIASPDMTAFDKMRALAAFGGSTVQTMTGIPPLTFKADGTPLISWSMKGNGSQQGTPTPDNPIMPEFVGVRTGNLANLYGVDKTFLGLHCTVSEDMSVVINGTKVNGTNVRPLVNPNITLPAGTYTVKVKMVGGSITNVTDGLFFGINSSTYGLRTAPAVKQVGDTGKITFTLSEDKLLSSIDVTPGYGSNGSVWDNATFQCWFYSGSDNKDYEPYGWKLPFENHGENLFDYVSYFDSTFTNYNQFFDYADLQLSANTTYTLSTSYTEVGTNPRNTSFIVAKPNDVPTTASGGISSTSPMTITTGSDGKLRLYKRISGSSEHPTKSQFDNGEWLMLTLGSTPKPYSPYLNATIPVYLSEVPTVRRVKKVVFDGTEKFWEKSISRAGCFAARDLGIGITEKTIYCTHAIGVITASELASNNTCYIGRDFNLWLDLFDAQTTTEQFNAYLASEYAAGHPVTVWYILATPITGIVNEPLAKIGDYADELSSTDAAVTIPTVKGSNTLTVDSDLQPSEMTIRYRE